MEYVVAIIVLIAGFAMINNFFESMNPGPKLEELMNDSQRELLNLMSRVDPSKAKFEYWDEYLGIYSRDFQKMTCPTQNLEVLIKTFSGSYSGVMELSVIKDGKSMIVGFTQQTTQEMLGALRMREREYKYRVKQIMDDLYNSSKVIKVDVSQEKESVKNLIRVIR